MDFSDDLMGRWGNDFEKKYREIELEYSRGQVAIKELALMRKAMHVLRKQSGETELKFNYHDLLHCPEIEISLDVTTCGEVTIVTKEKE